MKNENLQILHVMLHTWSDDEVNMAWRMIAEEGKRRKMVRTKKMKGALTVGDVVEYESRRTGKTTATIVKVKTKNALVEDASGQRWNVAMSMLKKVK